MQWGQVDIGWMCLLPTVLRAGYIYFFESLGSSLFLACGYPPLHIIAPAYMETG